MAKNTMAVEIENRYIKIVIGTRGKISKSQILNTPNGAIENDRIVDVEAVAKVINDFIEMNKVAVDNVIYTVHGQDTIIRHTEIAIMQEVQVGKAAIREIGQYLPRQGVNYYIDYQIIDKVNNDEKKIYKVLVAAVPRVKINGYVELTKKLDMKLKAIDILPISVSRTFKNYFEKSDVTSVGIIDIENKFSSIVILDRGKIFIEKEVDKGIYNAVGIVEDKIHKDYEEAYSYFMSKFNFAKQDYSDEIYGNLKNNFDDIFKAFDRVVRFYTAGKTKKTLDKVFIVGEGAKIYGIEAYLQDFMGTDVTTVEDPESIKLKVNFQNQNNFNNYLNVYGSLLRKGKKELNLVPDNKRKYKINILSSSFAKIVAASLMVVFIAACVIPITIAHIYSSREKDDEYKLKGFTNLQAQHDVLLKKINTYNSRIKLVDKLTKGKTMLNEKIQDINKYVPSDVKFDSIDFDKKGGIIISGETTNSKAPAALVANLQMSDTYKNSRLIKVTNSQDNNSGNNNVSNVYKFTIDLGDGLNAKNNAKG
ncbi:pilus assembly protein PilM [Clostridium guangxiense]|uniref:pilus assembly protein PilM n=1 Tax=Clostridium guangxiense TaxID=1662055 RepID=UPI001E46B88F|nr:pilus assembly protein PilM [Clostridium guangxiense]MCD2346465.1 pilus assembly protein PilM [Clostridium guangxiense]